ncbi:hypothetical protein SLS54_006460 [Diplodia seriata]
MMPSSAARFAGTLLPLFAAAVHAVSLSDFTPRVDHLSDQCSTVYNRQISDCSSSDLETGVNCSVACISGLLSIASQVKSACADDDVAETSIIGVFLLGKGPEILCSNIAATTIGSGHTSTTSASHSTSAEQTSTKEHSSQTTDAGTTIIAGTSTTAESTTTAAATTTTSAETSTSAAETTAAASTTSAESSSESTEAASSSAAATTSSGGSSSDVNDGSGGGSPFDLAIGAGSPRTTTSTRLLGAAMGVWALLVFSLS